MGFQKPLGAVFFGLFLITWILPRRDTEQFQQDQALRDQLIRNEKKLQGRRRSRIWKLRARREAI